MLHAALFELYLMLHAALVSYNYISKHDLYQSPVSGDGSNALLIYLCSISRC